MTCLSFFSPSTPEATGLQLRFKPTHVQLVYLMLPVLNFPAVLLTRMRTLDALLELITCFPKASILHCAIARLIVAFEDSPYMFGKQMPAFRSPTDPLRLHFLLGGVLDFVLQVFGWTSVPSDNTPITTGIPGRFHLVGSSTNKCICTFGSAFHGGLIWKVFRLAVLLPIQALWEAYVNQPPPAVSFSE